MHSPVRGTYSGVLIYMCKHEENEKKHGPQVGDIFELLGRDTVYTSPGFVSWKQSLEGEFVSSDVSLNFREKTYRVVSLFCSVFHSFNKN